MNKLKRKQFLVLLLALSIATSVSAEEKEKATKPLLLRAETNAANMEMVIKDNFIKAKYASAEKYCKQLSAP